MKVTNFAAGLAVVGALALSTLPASAQKTNLSREAALKKCIAVMTQYVKFDGRSETTQNHYNPATTSERYNNLYNNCMSDHGHKP